MIDPMTYSILRIKPEQKEYLADLKHRIAKAYGISISDLKGKNLSRYIAEARHMFFYIAVKCTRITKAEMGRQLNRDHASVIYGIKKAKMYIEIKDKFFIEKLKKTITPEEVSRISDLVLTQIINEHES